MNTKLYILNPICFLLGVLFVKSLFGQEILPRPLPEFRKKIEPRASDSKPDFPKPLAAPKGAPNILIVLLDDVGFGASSTFGGPISTPTWTRWRKRFALQQVSHHGNVLTNTSRSIDRA
jgi:arylsulfatase